VRFRIDSCPIVNERPLIDSAFNIYMDPKTSEEMLIDRQILLHHMLVITLMPKEGISPNKEKLLPRESLKEPFATMSTYILSVFGTHIFCNSCSALNSTVFKGHRFLCWSFSQQVLSRSSTGRKHLFLSSCLSSWWAKGKVLTWICCREERMVLSRRIWSTKMQRGLVQRIPFRYVSTCYVPLSCGQTHTGI
jgi:hypothetical protein